MSGLEDLSVIVPTYNRQAWLDRQLDFWRDTNASVRILDGSPAAWSASGLAPNVRYHHMPVSIGERLDWAAQQLDTPYAVLLSDDEFLLPSALEHCLDALRVDRGLAACKGMAIEFDVVGGRVVAKPVYEELRGYRVDEATPRARMLQHMRPYAMASLWAVMPRRVFAATTRAMASGQYRSAAVGEIQVSLVAAALGRCLVLDELMWLRSAENENIWWADGRQTFAGWFADPANAAEVERFVESTVAAIDAAAPAQKVAARDVLDAAAAYVEWSRARFRYSLGERLRGAVLNRLPSRLREIARARGQARSGSSAQTLGQIGQDMKRAGVRVSEAELTRIENLVAGFHRSMRGVRAI